MLRELFASVVMMVLLMPGCMESSMMNESSESTESSIPFEITFNASTLDRVEDQGADFSLKDDLSDGPVMLLWIGAGCSGCQDWTDMIREQIDNGELDQTNISFVSVHRWSDFETRENVEEAFGSNSTSSHYTPWKVVLPTSSTLALDFSTEQNTDHSLYAAYGNPGTPTLQLVAQNGVVAWESKTYWADESVLEDGLTFFSSQVNTQAVEE
tara:strand:- start:75479 stop:76114 length:636 start_codon:yes stop_codon:yes gene_type:complete